MDKLLEILWKNPLLAVVAIVWIVGAATNASKKAGRTVSRRGAPTPRRSTAAKAVAQPLATPRQAPVKQAQMPVAKSATRRASAPLAGSAAQTPEQIAQEMRRVLGLAPDPSPPVVAKAEPVQPPPPPVKQRRADPLGSRAAGDRLEIHVDPHVGERIRDRHMRETKVGNAQAGRGAIGNLGGRTKVRQRAARVTRRFSMDDLRRVLVMNEILSPPVSMRSHDDRRPI